MKTIFIDYGHGGIISGSYQTAGKRYKFTDVKPPLEIFEGQFNRELSVKIINKLLKDFKVIDALTGKEIKNKLNSWQDLEQKDISLATRVANANKFPGNFYLSIHANAIGNSSVGPSLNARGCCIYTSEGQTISDKYADFIYKEIEKTQLLKMRKQTEDKDYDFEENFYVLKNTKAPAALLETFFFTSIDDTRIMIQEKNQDIIAEAIAEGIRKCSELIF